MFFFTYVSQSHLRGTKLKHVNIITLSKESKTFYISTSGGTTQPKVLACMGGKNQFRSILKSVFIMKWVLRMITPPVKTNSQKGKSSLANIAQLYALLASFDNFTGPSLSPLVLPLCFSPSLLCFPASQHVLLKLWTVVCVYLSKCVCVMEGWLPPHQHFAQNKSTGSEKWLLIFFVPLLNSFLPSAVLTQAAFHVNDPHMCFSSKFYYPSVSLSFQSFYLSFSLDLLRIESLKSRNVNLSFHDNDDDHEPIK